MGSHKFFTMIEYLTNVTFIWCIGLLVYAVLLRPLASHGFNRAYLLMTVLFGIGMAGLPFGWGAGPSGMYALRESTSVWLETLTIYPEGEQPAASSGPALPEHWPSWLYGAGLALSVGVTGLGAWRLVECFGESRPQLLFGGMLIRELPTVEGPFSVGRHLFVKDWTCYSAADARALVAHEAAHHRLLHTIDRVLMTLVKTVFWFHPLAYLLDRELRLVHEYHADAKALASTELSSYRRLLLAHQLHTRQPLLAAAFAHSPLQNRFTMMTRTFQMNQAWRVALATLALLITALACSKEQEFDEEIDGLEAAQADGLTAEQGMAAYADRINSGEYQLSVDTIEVFDPETGVSVTTTVLNIKDSSGKVVQTFQQTGGDTSPGTGGKRTFTSERVRGQEVLKIAEEMPHFPSADCTSGDRACYEKALLQFVYTNVEYPEADKVAGVEGKVIAQFVVGTDGELLEPKVIRGPSETLNEEVLRVIREMPAWVPGQQDGRDVQVSFVLPVQFKLE